MHKSPSQHSTVPNNNSSKNENKWNCLICTLENDEQNPHCDACNGPSPLKNDLFGSKICRICTAINGSKDKKCINCQTKLEQICCYDDNIKLTLKPIQTDHHQSSYRNNYNSYNDNNDPSLNVKPMIPKINEDNNYSKWEQQQEEWDSDPTEWKKYDVNQDAEEEDHDDDDADSDQYTDNIDQCDDTEDDEQEYEEETDDENYEHDEEEYNEEINEYARKQSSKAKARAVVNGVIGVAALGFGMVVAAQVIKSEMVANGQAEWGSFAPPQPKSGICTFLKSCNRPTAKHSDYCPQHTSESIHMSLKPQFNAAQSCIIQ